MFVREIITEALDEIVAQGKSLPRSAADLRIEVENSSGGFLIQHCIVEYHDAGDDGIMIELSEFVPGADAIGYRYVAPTRFELTPRLSKGRERELTDRAEGTGP